MIDSVLFLLVPMNDSREELMNVWTQEEPKLESWRLVFASMEPREEHLRRIQFCDIIVDTRQNGQTTSLDSFSMYRPVVSLVGPNWEQRVTLSMYCTMRIFGLAVDTLDRFIDVATELGNNADLQVSYLSIYCILVKCRLNSVFLHLGVNKWRK